MRKLLIICFSLILSCISFAQEEHMKFMGIPLDGTINEFQAKLATKGVTVAYEESKSAGVGKRVFKGSFSGKEAYIFVSYDDKTKIVYRATVGFYSYKESINDSNYKYFLELLSIKYSTAEPKNSTFEGQEMTTFPVPCVEATDYKYLGWINVSRKIVTNWSEISDHYYLYIDYFDRINWIKHENMSKDDL